MQRNFIFNGMYSTRYHTMDVHTRQDIGNHSCGVAWLCELITAGEASKNLIMAALAHDLAEHKVGDIPSPAKRALNISAMFDKFENAELLTAGIGHYADRLTAEEAVILKFADMLEGMMFCLRERKFGNRNVEIVFSRFNEYVNKLLAQWGFAETLEVSIILSEINNEWEELTNERNVKRECKAGSGNALSIEISTLGLGGDDKSTVSSGGSDEVSDTVEEKERNTGS